MSDILAASVESCPGSWRSGSPQLTLSQADLLPYPARKVSMGTNFLPLPALSALWRPIFISAGGRAQYPALFHECY